MSDRQTRGLVLTIVLLVAVVVSGCRALSVSSMSLASFTSAMSSLTSSSALWAANDDGYARDIAGLTSAVVGAEADRGTFLRELGEIATRHGINDWEARDVTFLAIGVGLREGGLTEAGARSFERDLFGGGQSGLVLTGYRHAARS
jgi:hypothetical protein